MPNASYTNRCRLVKKKILNLKEFINSKDYNRVPEIMDKIEVIYHSDFWDGIISGIVRIKSKLFWMEMLEENEHDTDWDRKFAIVILNENQLEKELAVHRDFQRFVGVNCDHVFLKLPPELLTGKKDFLYVKHKKYIKDKGFENNQILGWVVD